MNYQAPAPQFWTGRKTNPNLGQQYWYQAVKLIDLNKTVVPNADVALLGYACEEGVRRNLGRIGAAQGPAAIRQKLGRLAYHLSEKTIIDAGDILCLEEDMEGCQEAFAEKIRQLLSAGILPIGLGGGHDIAYAHALGILQFLAQRHPQKTLGIINLDAHFDLRQPAAQGHSGSPFYQLLQNYPTQVRYFPIGIQEQANPPILFETAKNYGVNFLSADACLPANWEQSKLKIDHFIAGVDNIYLSIDLDGFSSAYAPGVSAPSPLGFSPIFAKQVIKTIRTSGKLLSCDIAELNPRYDRDEQTAYLAAGLLNQICSYI